METLRREAAVIEYFRQGRLGLNVRPRTGRSRDRHLAALVACIPDSERFAKAPNLKLAITAGIGSDHVDLESAIERGVTVAEVTYCSSFGVAEHVVMMIVSPA